MRSTITLNGINSNTITGLLIQNLPPISKPLMRTQIEEIDGRDGDVITKLGFSAYNKEITIGLYGDFDINQIIQYFTSQGTVVFSNEPDKYYYYQIIDQIDFERLIRYRTATVTMHCQPFKYSTTEGTEVFDNSNNLLTIPNFTKTTNGITVNVANNVITVSGTGSAATEFYIPIDTLSLSVGKYGMYALGSGRNPQACSVRVINESPSNANSFGGNYVTLQNNKTVALLADLATAKTYNYVWFYIAANTAMDFTLNLSIEDAASSYASGEGNQIALVDTALAPFSKFDLKAADTEQQTYSGKNLWKLPVNATSATTTLTNNADGTFNITGTANADGNFRIIVPVAKSGLVSGQTYSLWSNKSLGWADNAVSCYIQECTSTGTWISNVAIFQSNTSQTIPTLTADYVMFVLVFRNGTKFNDYNNVKIQLVAGSSIDQNFEPYVGGIPAPNPDYPQAVQVVTGEQTVTITDGAEESQEYEVNLGKNLFDKTAATLKNRLGPDGSLIADDPYCTSDYINVSPSETYTYSRNVSGAGYGAAAIVYYDSSKTFISRTMPIIPTSSTSGALVTPSNARYVRICDFTSIIDNMQFEKGPTATTYAPYFTPIELCKIGDYQDYIYKSGDDWYVHKAITKLDIDENTGLELYTGVSDTGFTFFKATVPTSKDQQIISNYFDTSFQGWNNLRNQHIEMAQVYTNDLFYLKVLASRASTLTELNNWLTGRNVVAYYPLATATDTQITDTSLIEQLEALVTTAHAYSGATNLTSRSENLPHIMSVEVAKNNDATITNSGNTTAKPVMTVYGSGTIGIYLNGNQIFNVNLGDNQYITIDTANMEAYKDTTDNLMNRLVDGDYSNFVLQTGQNTISFSGTVTKLEISNYSRWI